MIGSFTLPYVWHQGLKSLKAGFHLNECTDSAKVAGGWFTLRRLLLTDGKVKSFELLN